MRSPAEFYFYGIHYRAVPLQWSLQTCDFMQCAFDFLFFIQIYSINYFNLLSEQAASYCVTTFQHLQTVHNNKIIIENNCTLKCFLNFFSCVCICLGLFLFFFLTKYYKRRIIGKGAVLLLYVNNIIIQTHQRLCHLGLYSNYQTPTKVQFNQIIIIIKSICGRQLILLQDLIYFQSLCQLLYRTRLRYCS